ncbi:hypothetical protein [Rhodocista pekingensis]|uniref:PIN domain-containing protein n=1 Tax=Rhodocista pekingensis TaxID=201185 RepID=A0ABW2KSS3_9PROT
MNTTNIERHSRARQVELGKSLVNSKKIYLDTCFWIKIRDAALGILAESSACRLLDNLRSGVAGGRFVCPISASMFLELMKQPYTSDRRIGTARLIDELSLGIAMVPSHIVMETEIYLFFSALQSGCRSLFYTRIDLDQDRLRPWQNLPFNCAAFPSRRSGHAKVLL